MGSKEFFGVVAVDVVIERAGRKLEDGLTPNLYSRGFGKIKLRLLRSFAPRTRGKAQAGCRCYVHVPLEQQT